MSRTRYHTAVLGGGAVGTVAALASAKRSPTVLIVRSAMQPGCVPRIEAVPAPILSVLIDFGVHPRRIGVDRLHERRCAAWGCAEPEMQPGHAMAHIDKAKLHRELLNIAKHSPHLDVVIDEHLPTRRPSHWLGSNWSAERLIDATGRAAATAARRIAAPKPWVARPFWSVGSVPLQLRSFRIAALPFGYAYRISSHEIDSLWIAGRGAILSGAPKAIQAALIRARAGWLMEGLPSLESLQSGRGFPVSVQWSEASAAMAVGDAALARDVLSSQGIAAGLSSACYAAACDSERDTALLLHHQRAERARHLESLSRLIASSRYVNSAAWQQYREFIGRHLSEHASHHAVCLSKGRLLQASA